jgi:hypothetical protein
VIKWRRRSIYKAPKEAPSMIVVRQVAWTGSPNKVCVSTDGTVPSGEARELLRKTLSMRYGTLVSDEYHGPSADANRMGRSRNLSINV